MSDYKQFDYILEIARTESISMAAENLHISQPALSKYIKKIESELGTELFDRSTSPISLTQAGRYYVEAAKRILDVKTQLEKQIHELKSAENVEIRIGISPSRAPYLLPVILPLFMKAVPTVHIIIEEGTATELAEKLAHGEVDLIISLLNTDTEGFERVHLFDEMMYLAVPGNYKSHSVHEIFRNIPLITSGKGQVMEVLFEQLKRELGERENLMECRNMSTALSLVDAGVGVTLVPSYMKDYGEPYKDIAYLSLSGFLTEQERRVCIFFRKEQYLSRAEKKFIDCSLRAINNKEK